MAQAHEVCELSCYYGFIHSPVPRFLTHTLGGEGYLGELKPDALLVLSDLLNKDFMGNEVSATELKDTLPDICPTVWSSRGRYKHPFGQNAYR